MIYSTTAAAADAFTGASDSPSLRQFHERGYGGGQQWIRTVRKLPVSGEIQPSGFQTPGVRGALPLRLGFGESTDIVLSHFLVIFC